MLPDKIEINAPIRMVISDYRDLNDITAEALAKKCGKNRYWLTNIETGRTKKLPQKDIVLLFTVIMNCSKKEAEKAIEEFLKTDILEHADLYERYENNQSKKMFQKKTNRAIKAIHEYANQIDFDNKDSILKYEPYVTTLSELLTTDMGKHVFKCLFKYPIQRLDSRTVEKICELIENENIWKYEIDYDSENKPYLKITDGADDIFS